MSLYGHTNINIEALKRWSNSLSVENIFQLEIGGEILVLNKKTKKILESQVGVFQQVINQLKEDDDWRVIESVINPVFYNAFVRIDHSSIKMADFFECLIVPSNVKTYKKMIKGFDYCDIGAINIKDNEENLIASIGRKSDLIWKTFYEYFINDNYDGSIDYVYSNPEHYMSIQLFNIEHLTVEELYARVAEVLLQVSMEYDMDFKIIEVDSLMKAEGECNVYNMVYNPTGFEQIPMLYLQNGINADDERLSFLSYYQVIEYFFVRAQNYFFLDELNKIDINNVNHNELRKVLAEYKKISNEREALRLVLKKAVDISQLKIWISSDADNEDKYCNSSKLNIDITKDDKKIISALVERVYSFRCSIAHSKGNVEEYIAVPSLSRDKIENELPLLKYLAFEVIRNCSEI